MEFRIDHERYVGCRYTALSFDGGQWVLEYTDSGSSHTPERLRFDSRAQWRAFVVALRMTVEARDRQFIDALDGGTRISGFDPTQPSGLSDKCMRIVQGALGIWMDWTQWEMTLDAAEAAIATWERLRPVARPLPTSLSESLAAPRVAVAA